MAWLRTGMVCRNAVDLVTEYLEDALPPRGRARFEAHLAGCPLAPNTCASCGSPSAQSAGPGPRSCHRLPAGSLPLFTGAGDPVST